MLERRILAPSGRLMWEPPGPDASLGRTDRSAPVRRDDQEQHREEHRRPPPNARYPETNSASQMLVGNTITVEGNSISNTGCNTIGLYGGSHHRHGDFQASIQIPESLVESNAYANRRKRA